MTISDGALLAGLVQPDNTTCGPSALVAARMLLDATYRPDFASDVLALHRSATATVFLGRPQVPWPLWFGTPPWSVARGMRFLTGRRHRVRIAAFWGRAAAFAAARVAIAAGHPCPLYVGDHLMPRHVVLAIDATDDGLLVYNPGSGLVVTVAESDYVAGTLTGVSWSMPWYALVPDGG